MNITKFSLPEGCDLKLTVHGVAANVVVTYKGEQIAVVCNTMMGLGLSVRRAVLGVNYVLEPATDSWGRLSSHRTRDIRQAILDAIESFRSASDVLADNLRHFENLSMSSETMERMMEVARQSFRATQDRMGVAASSMSFRTVDTFSLPSLRGQYYTRSQLDHIRPHAVYTLPTQVDTNEE